MKPNLSVDRTNFIIRGVSVITKGIARGHDLEVDDLTLKQLLHSAEDKGQVRVMVDHRSGAANLSGFLVNFRIVGPQILADWHLLQSYPQAAQILETAERMPACVGLSVAFVSPKDNPTPGRARCAELVSVDYVAAPAANPDGIFARVDGRLIMFAVPGLGRAVAAGVVGGGRSAADAIRKTGFKIPSKLPAPLNGVGLTIKRGWRLNKPMLRGAAVSGAINAAVVGTSVYAIEKIHEKQREDEDRRAAQRARRRQMSARVGAIMFGREATIHRVIDATSDNLPAIERPEIPGETVVKRVWKSDLARAARLKLAKIGILSGAGAYAGHKLLRKNGAKIGAITGATAGILFSDPASLTRIRESVAFAAKFRTKLL